MHTTDAPASAGEQLSFPQDSPGQPPAGDQATTTVPHIRDTAVPADPALTAHTAAGTSTDSAQALARLIADGRKPRSQRFTALEPYRDVLLTERRAGASIRLLTQSLAKLGVTISEETLRVWFLKEKLPKRRRPRKKRAATPTAKVSPVSPTMVARPAIFSGPAPAQGTAGTQPGRRGPRIARDNY